MTAETGEETSSAAIMAAAEALGLLTSSAQAAPQILATLCRADVGPRQVAQVIAGEPGLTARVLRVANSAFYGQSRSVATIDRALVVLGLDAVRGVAAAACLDRPTVRSAACGPFTSADLLRHSVAVAAAAQGLARARHQPLAGDAFVAGLLHDLGVPLQLRLDPGAFTRVVTDLAATPGCSVREAERRHALPGHEHCAAVVFDAWKLPAALVAAARHHHAPAGAPAAHRTLAALVGLGDHVAVASGAGHAAEPAPGPPPQALLDLLGLDADAVAAAGAGLAAAASELHAALYGT